MYCANQVDGVVAQTLLIPILPLTDFIHSSNTKSFSKVELDEGDYGSLKQTNMMNYLVLFTWHSETPPRYMLPPIILYYIHATFD